MGQKCEINKNYMVLAHRGNIEHKLLAVDRINLVTMDADFPKVVCRSSGLSHGTADMGISGRFGCLACPRFFRFDATQ